jgi:mycothione reductase
LIGVEHFDLAIIGSGSGNSLVTPELADRRIAIVENGIFGGTCINVGCIPTKMFVYAAEVAHTVTDSARFGVDATLDGVRWSDIRDRIFGRIDPISVGGRDYRANGPTSLYEATASFVDPHTLALSGGDQITADQIVIATGSRATVPPHVIASGAPFHTSDTIMRIDELPAHIAIIGGGFISAEFAHVFSSFGTKVSIISRSGHLLRDEDQEISDRFTELAADKWDVYRQAVAEEIEGDERGVRISLDTGATVEADLLFVATGRIPNSDRLRPEFAGIELDEDGRIVVDKYQRTNVEGVWALGDVSSPFQLKHVANHEARVVAHNLAHPDDLMASDHRFVPSAVFTEPQVASVGITEQEARERGIDYVAATQAYGDTAYGWAMEDTTSICKLIADPSTGQLLGAHLMGPDASSLIQPLIQALTFGLGVREMARGQYWIHPAMAEVVENALLKLPLPN